MDSICTIIWPSILSKRHPHFNGFLSVSRLVILSLSVFRLINQSLAMFSFGSVQKFWIKIFTVSYRNGQMIISITAWLRKLLDCDCVPIYR